MSSNSFLKTPFYLGDIALPSNVFCAPLAGCSDFPFRRMLTLYKPGLMYCEMVKMDALVRNIPTTYRFLDYEESMHPIGAQLCGSKPELAAVCAKIIEDLGFDVLDFNCGCPVDKVTKDGSGSGMLKTPERIGEIICEMVAAVKIPVTVKVRTGWDEHHINAPEITQIAEKAGAKAICVHGRTRQQGYTGPANWDHIRRCKEVAKEIKVIGNGDIFTAESAEKIFTHTRCDAILLSRGTFGQPWLAEDIYRRLGGLPSLMRAPEFYKSHLLQHMDYVIAYQPVERKAIFDMRRISCWYLKKGHGMRGLREEINRATSLAHIRELIESYPWHEAKFTSAPLQEEEQEEVGCEISG